MHYGLGINFHFGAKFPCLPSVEEWAARWETKTNVYHGERVRSLAAFVCRPRAFPPERSAQPPLLFNFELDLDLELSQKPCSRPRLPGLIVTVKWPPLSYYTLAFRLRYSSCYSPYLKS
jgi:hypothetical protein